LVSTPSERWWPVRDGFDVREGQLQGRLNRWMAHFVHHPPLPSVGVGAARQGYAYAANAPLTGFHSGSELPKQACRRLLITPSLFTSGLVT
ncbi:hypothetical protein GP954_36930, partial [Escherichia coli]|nr:hypothetical protein [Escherichia coli]